MRQHAPWIVAKGLLLMRAGFSPELNPTIVLLQEQSRGVSRGRELRGTGVQLPTLKAAATQLLPTASPSAPAHLPRAGVQA